MLAEGISPPWSAVTEAAGPTAHPDDRRPGWIVIVAYQGVADLPVALASCALHAPGVPLVVVDNASSDGGPELVRSRFPEVRLLVRRDNLGFGGGCNEGIRYARAAGADWVLLLNQDAELQPGALDTLRGVLETRPRVAAVQPAVIRNDGLVNSLGNPVHWLGFSEAGGNGLSVAEAERDVTLPWLHDGRWRSDAVEVPACSGAALMLRMAALDDVGLFEEELFLYHEDLELSWRLRRAGWVCCIAGAAQVRHNYSFSRNPRKWYFLERNRHWFLLAHLRATTLMVLAPGFVAAELIVWLMAVRGGWAREKADTYGYWFRNGRMIYLLQRRRALKVLRRVNDSALLATASTRLVAADAGRASGVAEPVSGLLWRVLRPLIRR